MTRKGHQDTKTLQVWPGGESYTYRGDLWGPASRRSLRGPHDGGYFQAGTATPVLKWRKGTAEEWRRIRVEERARRLQREEIYCCDSALVDDLIKQAGELRSPLSEAFEYDQIRNLYADPSEWDAARCREYAEENGVLLPDHHDDCPTCENIKPRGATCGTCAGTGYDPADDKDDSPRGWLTEARDACRDHAQDHPAEVYEWYRVSGYLCELLHAIGEVTIDNDYGYWWGRQTTGQNNLMDGVLQRCAMEADEQLRPGKGVDRG